jgi:aminoglycoside 3-N-acetyltransferase
MGQDAIIEQTPGQPATVRSLAKDLTALGVARGMVLLVHASLSSLGWVCGGPVAVILALEQALSREGTLVMPTFSGDISDPERWKHPPVPQQWWNTIRKEMPPYDPRMTPTRGMGIIPETFLKQPSVKRSANPLVSFAAWGAEAATVTAGHSLDFGCGEESPLARVYDLAGWVLLLGVGHGNNTSLHLGEFRASFPGRRIVTDGAPVSTEKGREWVTIQELDDDDSDFEALGESYERDGGRVLRGRIANAEAKLLPQRDLVDYATGWIEENR